MEVILETYRNIMHYLDGDVMILFRINSVVTHLILLRDCNQSMNLAFNENKSVFEIGSFLTIE